MPGVQLWIRFAESSEEHRYEDWNNRSLYCLSHILYTRTHTSRAYKRAIEQVLCPFVFDLARTQSLSSKKITDA